MPLASNLNEPGLQAVHVEGRVHTAPNFNDYVQTALLTANLVTQQETNNLLQQQITQQKLNWWKSVVLNRFPGISDPMTIEDSAKALMAWDQKEMRAGHRRYEGQHLPSKATWGDSVRRCVLYVICGLVAVPFLVIPAIFIDVVSDWAGSFNYLLLGTAAIVGLLIFNQIHSSLVWSTPKYNPTSDSELCRRFPPGSKIRDTQGEEYTVVGWPVYYAERLRFWYPVDHSSPRTTVNVDDGTPWLQSDMILWNNGVNNPIPGSVWS